MGPIFLWELHKIAKGFEKAEKYYEWLNSDHIVLGNILARLEKS